MPIVTMFSKNPDKGLEFVLENLNSKMLVFIDWNFSGHHKKGIDLLKEIRKKTSLLLYCDNVG